MAPASVAVRATMAAQHVSLTNLGLSLMHIGLYAAHKAGYLRWGSLPFALQLCAIKYSPAPGLYNVPTAATVAHWQVNAALVASTGGAAIY